MPILDTRPKDARRRMDQPRVAETEEQEEGQDELRSPKRRKADDSQPAPKSVHAWLHPDSQPLIMAQSPPLHSSSSTFLSISVHFTPPDHVVSETALAKEARRVVRELDVPTLTEGALLGSNDGAFQEGNGYVVKKGKQRIREPDHRMWAVRTLCLKERRDGTTGEDDYQLLETYNDDGEKFGGERVLRSLREANGLDVLTVCCRWYGGEMIGPIRFQHIGLTANTSLTELKKLVELNDLRTQLEALDGDISDLRQQLQPPTTPAGPDPSDNPVTLPAPNVQYRNITDKVKLGRLVKAREKTKETLEAKLAWAASQEASRID